MNWHWSMFNTWAVIMAGSFILVAWFIDWRIGKYVKNKTKSNK